MKRYLQCAEQHVSLSKLTKYCACHEKWPSKISKKFAENGWNVISNARPIRAWSDHDPRMKPSVRNPPRNRGYFSRPPRAFCIEKYNISRSGYHSKFHGILRLPRKVTLELHQVLRLPRKVTLIIDPLHTWNVIYNARSNKCHCPNSPNTAPATKNESHDWSLSQMKRYLQCAEQHVSLSTLTKYCACHEKWPSKISKKFVENGWNVISNARPIRAWSDHDPRMKPSVRNPPRNRGYFSRPPRAFCIEKYNISRSGYHSKFHGILRLPGKVTLELHQILRLPRKVTLIIDPLHTCNIIYNARSNKCHCPNSPNTAPATKNESHDWSLSQMKRYLQCAEQHVSLSTLTKYCACHEKWPSKISKKFSENGWNVISNARPIRAWSDHDPRMKPSVRNPPRNRGYFSRPPRAFCIEKYNISRSGYHSKFHRILRLPRKVTLELHQILRLPRKVTLIIDPLHTWNIIYNARSNKCHCPNSPNTAPATKNESHDWSLSQMKRYLQCAE